MTNDQSAQPAETIGVADRVELLWNGVQELTARLDTTEEVIEETVGKLGTSIEELKDQLPQNLKKEHQKSIGPRRWAARASTQDWDQLIDWVDQLTADYSLLTDHTIPPCWPAHPGVVEELAGLHHAWIIAMTDDEHATNTGSNNTTAWHDRWLWPCLRRMKAGHYRTTNCRDRHQTERITARATDRSFAPSAPSTPSSSRPT